jgi:hypothetical protein
MAMELDYRTRFNMTTKHTKWFIEWHHKKQPRQISRDDHRDLTATDITAKRLHMEIK